MNNKDDHVEYTEYDMKELFDKEIYPHVSELKKICKLNNLPIMISCAVTNRGGVTKYENDGVFTGSSNLKLYDDQFERMLLIMRGAKVSTLGALEYDKPGMDYILAGAEDSEYKEHFEAKTRITVLENVDQGKITQLKESLPEKKRRGRPKKNTESAPEKVVKMPQKKQPEESQKAPLEMVSFIGDL